MIGHSLRLPPAGSENGCTPLHAIAALHRSLQLGLHCKATLWTSRPQGNEAVFCYQIRGASVAVRLHARSHAQSGLSSFLPKRPLLFIFHLSLPRKINTPDFPVQFPPSLIYPAYTPTLHSSLPYHIPCLPVQASTNTPIITLSCRARASA